MKRVFLFYFFVFMGLAAQAQKNNSYTNEEKFFVKMNKIIGHRITGFYSNRLQADTTTSRMYASQNLRAYTLWEERWAGKTPDLWCYFGWFATGIADNPLTEYIAHVQPYKKDTLDINWYTIPDASQYKREWEKAKPFKDLTLDILQQDSSACSCQLVLDEKKMEARMKSTTPCAFTSNAGGKFRYVFFDVTLKPTMIIARNKYFDKDMNIVFEFKSPSQFKLLSKNRDKFTELD